MYARRSSTIPHQAQSPDDVERDVARTADLVLKLTSLAERYDAEAENSERVALMRDVAGRGRQQLAALEEWT